MVLHSLHIGMVMDFAKAQREVKLLIWSNILIAQHDYMMAQPGIVKLLKDRIIEGR